MKGIIMSGGMGNRLRPLTSNLPKPMVPIFNKPVMEYGVNLLKTHGIEDIGFTLFYLPNMIVEYFEDGSEFNINTSYYIENSPLGTGGSVKNADDFLDSTIIVISGDALTDIDLSKAYKFHKEKGSKATLILKQESIPLEYGVVVTDEEDRIIRFLEKPSWSEVFSDTVNTGIYILEPEVFDYYEKGENFDFSNDLFPRLLKDKVPMYGYTAEGYWTDVGDLNSYIQTHIDVFSNKSMHHILGKPKREGVWIGEGTMIEKGVKINPPVFIGKDCIIGEGAKIEPYTVIGDNTKIGKETSIKRSIIWENVNISNGCEIRKAVICNNVYIGDHSRIFEGAVIGAYSKIFKGSTVKPNVKIWPNKIVNENIVVEDNLIWGESVSKKLFGKRNISGIFNESITPELAVSIGIAFSSVINNHGTFLISSDENNLSKALKNAIISGVLSTGAEVIDIVEGTIPMCRFGIRKLSLNGGIYIRCDNSYEDTLYIEFFDDIGANIDKKTSKNMEKTLAFEDYKRAIGKEIKDISTIDNFSLIYLNEGRKLLNNIDKIKQQNLKIILYSTSQSICNLAKTYLESLGCEVEIIKSTTNSDIEELQELVKDRGANLGVVYTDNGEEIEITDGYDVVKNERYYILSLLIGLINGTIKNAVIPYHYPRIAEQLIEEYKANTLYSKSNISDEIKSVMSEEIDFQYIMNFDGIWAIGVILDYMVSNNTTLNQILKDLPKYFYMKKELPCKWTDKGNIIRQLSQEKADKIELIEGVRFIEDGGWVLIVPDEEKPAFNIYIEGYSQEYIDELWEKHNKKLTDMINDLANIL